MMKYMVTAIPLDVIYGVDLHNFDKYKNQSDKIKIISSIRVREANCKIKLVTKKTEWKLTIKRPSRLYLITTIIKII